MVTTGNHDMEAWYSPDVYGGQNARWTLPDNGPDPVNQPGAYSLAVEVEPGRHARMKVTALAESGERIDHFEISRAEQSRSQ